MRKGGEEMEKTNQTKGVLCILCSALCFAMMTACVRLAGELPTFEKAFFRNFVAMLAAGFIVWREKAPLKVPAGSGRYVFLRCLFGTLGLLFNFYAIDRLNLADANMLNKLSPFFAIIFSCFLLKEAVRPVQILAVVGAFCGALLIIKPGGSAVQAFPALLGFLGGMGAGAAYTCLRKATQGGAAGPVIVLYFSIFSCLAALPFIAVDFVMPTVKQTCMLLLCGVFGAGGQFAITAAYSFAPAKEISVYDYSQVIFSALIGFLLFGQVPDGLSVLGYVVIIAMAVMNFWYHKWVASQENT